MNNAMTATHVFFSRAQMCIIDTCTDDETPRSHIQGETLDEIRQRYSDAVYIDWETASREKENAAKLPVTETTMERFWEMLEVLPPAGWKTDGAGESFKLSERWSGNITDIYARIGKRYFHLCDDICLPHAEIIRRCEAL